MELTIRGSIQIDQATLLANTSDFKKTQPKKLSMLKTTRGQHTVECIICNGNRIGIGQHNVICYWYQCLHLSEQNQWEYRYRDEAIWFYERRGPSRAQRSDGARWPEALPRGFVPGTE